MSPLSGRPTGYYHFQLGAMTSAIQDYNRELAAPSRADFGIPRIW